MKASFEKHNFMPTKEVFKPAIRHLKANFLAKQAAEWKKSSGARLAIQEVEQAMREAWTAIFGKNHPVSRECLAVGLSNKRGVIKSR